MEIVVKEMSHLFQFFPEQVSPLEYPDQIDLQDNAGTDLFFVLSNIFDSLFF